MLKKFAIFVLLIAFVSQIISCASSNIANPPKNTIKRKICDTAVFNYDNNDTTKVLFLDGVVFDTSVCVLNGYVLDRVTLKPVRDAIIYLNDNFVLHAARTDQIGYFEIVDEIVCRADNWKVSIFHDKYDCMEFKYSQKYGGVKLRIKLREK